MKQHLVTSSGVVAGAALAMVVFLFLAGQFAPAAAAADRPTAGPSTSPSDQPTPAAAPSATPSEQPVIVSVAPVQPVPLVLTPAPAAPTAYCCHRCHRHRCRFSHCRCHSSCCCAVRRGIRDWGLGIGTSLPSPFGRGPG